MKKLLLIICIVFTTIGFAQQNFNSNGIVTKNQAMETLSAVSAYPNPFATKTKISFISSKKQTIEFTVKNILGKTVYVEKIESEIGNNDIQFNRNTLAQGMYIYSLQTETEVISKRLIIK